MLQTNTASAFLPRRNFLASAAGLVVQDLKAQAADKLPVTVSFSILGDLVRSVGGGRVAVAMLVGPDEDAHVFEPKPADAKTVLNSKLLVTNGLGFEPWASKLVQSAGYKGEWLLASNGVTVRQIPQTMKHAGHVEADPHAWQNPNNVMLYARNIAAGLTKVDPSGAVIYHANLESYTRELLALDTWIKEQFAPIPVAKRQVITSHDAFGYFAARYGINFLAAQGLNTDTEPNARQMAQLIRQIRREKIRAVFVENMSNVKLIEQIGKDAGATVGASLYSDALSAADKTGATYLQMMRHNVTQLARGMKRN